MLNVILHVYPHIAKYIFATLKENKTALWADHFGCLLCPSAKGREARLFSTHRLKLIRMAETAERSKVCSQKSMQATHALTSVSNVGNNKKYVHALHVQSVLFLPVKYQTDEQSNCTVKILMMPILKLYTRSICTYMCSQITWIL